MKRENKALIAQVEGYENQLKSWKNRHNALESRSKELQAEANQAGITAARLTAMEEEMRKLQLVYDESTTNTKRLQEEGKNLRESLRTTKVELGDAKQAGSDYENEENVSAAAACRSPRSTGSCEESHACQWRACQWARSAASDERPNQPGLFEETQAKKRRGRESGARPLQLRISSTSKLYGHHNLQHSSPETIPARHSAPFWTMSSSSWRNLLSDEDGLNEEVTVGLIKNLKIPAPSTTPTPTDKEVLFPAYLINLVYV